MKAFIDSCSSNKGGKIDAQNPLKAIDEHLLDQKFIFLCDCGEKDLEKYFQLLNFRLVTTKKKYGPFGSSDLEFREPIAIPIENGDVLAQMTNYFIYQDEDYQPTVFENEKCFSFYVGVSCQRTYIIEIFSHKSGILSSVGLYQITTEMFPYNTMLTTSSTVGFI